MTVNATCDVVRKSVDSILKHTYETRYDLNKQRELVTTVCTALANWSLAEGHRRGYAEGWDACKRGVDDRRVAHVNKAETESKPDKEHNHE